MVEPALVGLANLLDANLPEAASPVQPTVTGRVGRCDDVLVSMFHVIWINEIAAVSQPVTDRLPQSTVKARLCGWVTLTMSSSAEVMWNSKAWTCLHCSQRYAYTDQLKAKVSVPSMFITQDAQLFVP